MNRARRNHRLELGFVGGACLLAAIVLGTCCPATAATPEDGPWAYATDLPFVTYRIDAEFYDGKLYVTGYREESGGTDGSVWVYDPLLDAWSDTGVDLPVPVSNYTIAKLEDANGVGLYVFGGRDTAGSCTTAVQVYYPDLNTASVVATDPWPGTVNASPVFPGGVVVVGGLGFAWGGFCGATTPPYTSNETWIFDPLAAAGSRWTSGPTLPSPGAYQAGALLDGIIYSIGGDTYDGINLYPYATVLSLDPGNLGAGWQARAPLPLPSSGIVGCESTQAFGFDTGSAWSPAGHIVVAGCGQWPDQLADSFLYDGASNSWTTFDPLNLARRNHGGAFILDGPLGGRMWVGGGFIPGGTNLGTATAETYALALPRAVVAEIPTLTPFGLAAFGALLAAAALRARHFRRSRR